MPILRFDNLGTVGIIQDLPAHDLPPEAWSAGSNVRFRDNLVEKFSGHDEVLAGLSVVPFFLQQARLNAEAFWVAMGLGKAYVSDGTTWKDITKTLATYTATADDLWTGGLLGGVPFFNNPNDLPQYWDRNFATPGLMLDLPGWNATWRAGAMSSYKNFLIAMDITENSVRFEDVIRWSHPASPGNIPTSWDETDATLDAGRRAISSTVGPVLAGMRLADIFVFYKEQGTYGLSFIGGNNIFRSFTIFEGTGILGRHCVSQIAGGRQHVVLTNEADIVIHQGSAAPQSIISKKLRRWLRANISTDNYARSFLVRNVSKEEIWACIVTEGATAADVALVFSFRDGSWTFRDLPNINHAAWGVVTPALANETWDADTDFWDTDDTVWGERNFNARDTRLLMAPEVLTKVYRADTTNQFAGVDYLSFIERLGIPFVGLDRFGNKKADFTARKYLRSIRPRMESTGPVTIRAAAQELKDGPVTMGPALTFDPTTDFKVDTDISGRLLGLRIEATADISWTLSGYDMDIEILGAY